MKKKIITILLFLFSACYGYSQLSWNAKAGMNLSRITNYGEVNMKPGYQFGVGMDYYFTNHLGIQPSLMIISKGYKDKNEIYVGDFEDGYGGYYPNASYNQTLNRIYIELPVMLAYRFNVSGAMKLVINGGGYVSYGIGGKCHYKIAYKDGSTEMANGSSFSERTQKSDFGLSTGTALEYKNRYTLSLFGEWGLKKHIQTCLPS